MKKATLCTILALCLFMLAGCKSNDKAISPENVKANTLLVKNDGSVQAAFVEAFDKNYYSLTELNDFISQEINKYNSEEGAGAVTLLSLDQKDGNAVLILKYKDLNHYSKFNQTETIVSSVADVQSSNIVLPDTFINAKNGETVSKDTALSNSKYKVLAINESTEVIIEGSIKYYSTGTLVDSSKLQTAAEGQTTIIYKP
jgi:Skp family chaperone for outer membrane proteins